MEHTDHIDDVRHVPLRHVTVKRSRSIEHTDHIDDVRHAPLRDVAGLYPDCTYSTSAQNLPTIEHTIMPMTQDTSHFEKSSLNIDARENMPVIS